jgi:hypothetical protein
MGWAEFCEAVANEPQGKLFRHNVAGDLPHNAGEIDAPKFLQLCDAVREAGLTGWTYTHHEPKGQNLHLMRYANAAGFTVNLSADSLTEADEFVKLECGPVCVTLPQGSAQVIKTPAGNTVRKCPAQVRDGITCAQCQWCALPSRGFIVGFEAHGTGARKLTQRLENENGGKL